ncbi:MAG TPA: hypothetical protein VMS76_17465 [Planctomycetota bacterium]|nr:hypothetical protein [Planctomycetota bacterium]
MMETWIPAVAALVATGVALRLWYTGWRRRRIASRRRVEAPNSQYSSQGVRNHEDRERWGRIDLSKLHPLNQDEVRRLLDVLEAQGIAALSIKDRVFLDNMALERRGGRARRD